jgi:hypothetical protein
MKFKETYDGENLLFIPDSRYIIASYNLLKERKLWLIQERLFPGSSRIHT